MHPIRSTLRIVGSLWFAAVLLVLLMVAMGSATVFEQSSGTERALAEFYHAPWFRLLLVLFAVNSAAAVVARWPFNRRQLGFLLTHGGILVLLLGTLGTKYLSVQGRVGIAEGETVDSFITPEPLLKIVDSSRGRTALIDLDDGVFSGFAPVENPAALPLELGPVRRVEVLRYLPDARWERTVIDGGREPNPAVEVSLSDAADPGEGVWLVADQTRTIAGRSLAFRVIEDPTLHREWLAGPKAGESASLGTLRVEHEGATVEIPLEACMKQAAAVEKTPYKVRVLRYLPHAIVTREKNVMNASDRPENPAVELELSGPEGNETRVAFARFPDFQMSHGQEKPEKVLPLKVTFEAGPGADAPASIEIVRGPDGSLQARFGEADGARPVAVEVGTPIPVPGSDLRLTVLHAFDRARWQETAVPTLRVRETRDPAVLVKLLAGSESAEVWLRKYEDRTVELAGGRFRLGFESRTVPLGFLVKLKRFRIQFYPGKMRPRSFESHITIEDPARGFFQDGIISMNHPASYGGYTFYQSSYRRETDRNITFLSVSRDPDQGVVFAGYIITILGMLWVLVTRMRDPARAAR
jgi:hypothetical protein